MDLRKIARELRETGALKPENIDKGNLLCFFDEFAAAVESEADKYDALLAHSLRQEQTMKTAAEKLRKLATTDSNLGQLDEALERTADELDPPESIAEADAAEKFSQDCEKRRVESDQKP